MKVKVIDKTDTEIRIEIGDESHTLLNSLKTLLLNDPRVELATYHIEHPTITEPILYVKTMDVDPIVAIKDASDSLVEVFKEFKNVFNNKTSM
jgi:DNA-directed RNA polymerase subunit L